MFNWVVKVVPQPPETSGTDEAGKASATDHNKNRQVKSPLQKNTDEASDDSQAQSGVLGWLSNGFVSSMPQPTGSPRPGRADTRLSGEDGESSGVIGWVTQGLTKVLPQPDEKYKESKEDEEHTEVYEIAKMPDYDPLPHVPVVEMESENEVSEVEIVPPQFPPNVVNWLKQMVPQPVTPGSVPTEPSSKSSRSSLDKILSPPPESLSGISLDTDSKASGVVGWFMSGLGLKIPQPAIPPKDDAEAASEVLKKVSVKLKPDMVLEDVESDNEGTGKHEHQSQAAAPPPSLTPPTSHQQQEASQQSSSLQSQKCSDANPQAEQSESGTKMSQEDAETQTGRWTPFIESIKREAEDVALATMEERLMQERLEMARMAEEVARQTAEMAIRQMASEGQSIKLSLGSQELLDEPTAELPEPQEDESQVVDDCKPTQEEQSLAEEEVKEVTEDSIVEEPEAKEEAEPQQTSPSPPPSPEPVETAEPEPEPESQPESQPEPEPEPETKEASPEAEPITQQPQKSEKDGQSPNADKTSEKEEEATGDGCGDSSSLSLRPAVNVEDVDSDHEIGGRGRGGEGQSNVPQILTPQDPKLTTLTVPVTPSGGRQSKGEKE